ncbi:threonine dehydrogenase-like Zn-dependent dehydrogenase [Streptomyces sp. B4I13]|nr:threonine dehydrogenase-like Zn-dependent dehydrogenase [Streptomyces sp. B4I13]
MRLGEGSTGAWAKSRTGGEGTDFVISALGAKAPVETMLDSMQGVRRGGRVVNVGGVADRLPVDVKWLMDEQVQLIGSNWFTTAQGQEVADMVATGALDLSYLISKPFPLPEVNEAISGRATDLDGGFSNYVVIP